MKSRAAYLHRLGNRLFCDRQAGLQVVKRIIRMGFIFERQGAVGRKLDLPECLEQGDDIEMPFAEHDVVRFFAELGVVLQMHTMDAIVERKNAPDRVFAAGEEVTAIDAGADARIVVFDRLHHAVQLVV